MRNLERVRARCAQALCSLTLPDPFDIETLACQVAAKRGRPVHLIPMRTATDEAAASGVWLATADADLVLYEQDTSALHQKLIILHELAHIWLGHQSPDGPGTRLPGRLFPDLSPELIETMLCRALFSDEQEQEAEMLASLILRHTRASAVSGGGADGWIGLLGHSLRHPRRPK